MPSPSLVFELSRPSILHTAKEYFKLALLETKGSKGPSSMHAALLGKGSSSMLTLAFRLTAGNDLSLVHYFSKAGIPFLYQSYRDRAHGETIHIFSGQLLSHEASGRAPRFQETHSFFEALKPLHISNCQAYKLHLACAFTFEERFNFPSLSAFIPQWHYCKNAAASFLSFYYLIDASSDLAQLEAHFLKALEVFEGITEPDIPPLPSLTFLNRSSLTLLKSTVEAYPEAVGKALESLKSGQYQKITLAAYRDYRLLEALDLASLIFSMKANASACTTVYCLSQGPSYTFFGATPETLLQTEDHTVFVDALAGSIPRQDNGDTAPIKEATLLQTMLLKMTLLEDPKLLKEHQLVVDAIIQDLQALHLKAQHPPHPEVRSLQYVHHLFTPIQARYEGGCSVFSLLQALHPTPALGTYPKLNGVHLIASLEGFQRGLYGGGLGWVNSQDDSHIIVNIRSAEQKKDRIRFFAGCGLTAESVPSIEQKELEAKLKTLLRYFNYNSEPRASP